MKLSQYKSINVVRKLQYVNGEAIIKNIVDFNGEIGFYATDIDRLTKINEEIIQKIEKISNDEITYKFIPYLCDVECDISFEEFTEMLEHPTQQFIDFMTLIAKSMNDIFEMLDSIANMSETTENVQVTVNRIQENIPETIISEEEQLDELYSALSKTSDKDIRKSLIRQITELENKEK
jgi:hypothetical protein